MFAGQLVPDLPPNSNAEVVKMLRRQAIGLGLIAATIAVAATIAAGLALSASRTVMVGAVATALGMNTATTGIAVLAALSHAYAADPRPVSASP